MKKIHQQIKAYVTNKSVMELPMFLSNIGWGYYQILVSQTNDILFHVKNLIKWAIFLKRLCQLFKNLPQNHIKVPHA